MEQRLGTLEGLEVIDRAFWKGKKVFLTGHTGFKGSWMSLWLTEMGAQVTGYALAPPTKPSLFEAAELGRRMKSVINDVRDPAALAKALKESQAEIVIHMAAQALVRLSYQDPVGTYATNVMGTVHLFEAARQTPTVRTVLNVTSDKCYENREWPWGYRETDAMGGYDPYSSSKGCSELVTSAYRRSFLAPRVGLASSRAGNVIGGGDWALDRLIPDCVRAMMAGEPITIRNPGAVRPWQHVLEPVGGYLGLVQQLWAQPDKFSDGWNFGPDMLDARPVNWIADRMVNKWGKGARWFTPPEYQDAGKQPHEAFALRLDCSKTRAVLGWEPKLKLDEALDWTVSWFRDFQAGQSAQTITLAQIEQYADRGEKQA